MNKLICLILAAGTALAQTTRYPGAVDNDGSLFIVADNVQTTLSAAMSTSDTAAVVASAAGFVPNMIATICDTTTNTGKCTAWEHMLVTAVAGNILTVTRAFAGTTARTHSSGRLVSVLIDSAHQKVLKDSLIAIETALGPNLSNISASGPLVNASSFNFSAYSCNSSSVCVPSGPSGMSLIAGNNSLTMSPVPNGVNGTDTNHRLYVSGGTGTAEACLITGGSGTAGQASGQIIINCANTHSGAWTIQSYAGGIQEAIQTVTAAGGTVIVPSGTTQVRAAIQIPSNVTLAGNGQNATTLFVPNGALTYGASWTLSGVPGYFCIVCMVNGGTYQRVRDLTVDANGANQTWNYYADVLGSNASHGVIDSVTVKNHPISGGTGVMFQWALSSGVVPINSSYDNVIRNATSIGIANCTVPNGGGAYYIQGVGIRILSSFAINFCDVPYVLNTCDHCLISDSVADVGSGQMSTPTFGIEGATNSVFLNDQCVATGTNANRFCVGIDSVAGFQSIGNMVIGVSASHVNTGLEVGNRTAAFGSPTPVTDTQIIGLRILSASLDCVDLVNYVNKVSLTGGSLTGCGGNGITIASTGAIAAGTVVQNVLVNGVTIDHSGASGIVAQNSSSGPVVNGITITSSFIGDTYASPTQLYAVNLQAGAANNAYIAGNTMTGNTGAQAIFIQSTLDANSVVGSNLAGFGTYGAFPYTVGSLGSASAAGAGRQRYCVDCAAAATCAGGGTGHMATSNGTAWTCN